jgi:polygalacturonase
VLIENCDIRSPYKPVPAPSTDGIDIDVCKKVTIRGCYISVNDDAIAIKGGKGVDAHKRAENGLSEDVLIENCTFGEAHATLTFGSECIQARNITMKNCKVNNKCPILNLKMRPDTYQVFENITIDNITGKCGVLVNMSTWKQFFNLNGSNEKPYGAVRGVTMSNINVACDKLGTIEGNANDTVTDFTLKDSNVTTETPTLKNKYSDVKVRNVTVNGKPWVAEKVAK